MLIMHLPTLYIYSGLFKYTEGEFQLQYLSLSPADWSDLVCESSALQSSTSASQNSSTCFCIHSSGYQRYAIVAQFVCWEQHLDGGG